MLLCNLVLECHKKRVWQESNLWSADRANATGRMNFKPKNAKVVSIPEWTSQVCKP